MSVLKRGNSRYWYIQFQFSGKTYIKSSKTTEKKVAERMEMEWKVKLHSNEYLGVKESIHFVDMMTQFLRTKEDTASHQSMVVHSRILKRLFPVNKYLNELTNSDIERFTAYSGEHEHRFRTNVNT